MANKYTGNLKVDYDKLKSINDDFKKNNNDFKVGPINMVSSSTFNSLISPDDFASRYLNEMRDSMDEIIKFAEKNSLGIDSITSDTNGSKKSFDGSDGGGDASGTVGAVASGVSTNAVNNGKEISGGIYNYLVSLDLKDMVEFIKNLININNNIPLDLLLLDPSMADKIKEVLLKCINLPSDLKEKLLSSDSEIVRVTLLDIMGGKYPDVFSLNPMTLGIVYDYLNYIAEENDITVSELLNNSKYEEILRDALNDFEKAEKMLEGWDTLDSEEYQEKLLNNYDGAGIGKEDEKAVDIVRNFVEYLSEETNITSEDLLTDKDYSQTLKKAGTELAKTSLFVSTVGKYSEDNMRNVISSLVDGRNAEALGMNENSVNAFKGQVDNLAKSKGITSDNLLSDSSYKDEIKDLMSKNKNMNEMLFMYRNDEAKTVQNVARNIYNTEYKEDSSFNRVIKLDNILKKE